MVYKHISAKTLISKLYSDLNLQLEVRVATIMEWVAEAMEYIGAKQLDNGYSLRYIYLIDKSCKITVPIIPFSKIAEMGAEMYKGKKITRADVLNKSSLASSQEMAVTPTSALKTVEKQSNGE